MKKYETKTLDQLTGSPPLKGNKMCFTLDEALRIIPNFPGKEAYHIRENGKGIRIYGLEGRTQRVIEVPNSVYETMGSPDEEQIIPVSDILDAAGIDYSTQ